MTFDSIDRDEFEAYWESLSDEERAIATVALKTALAQESVYRPRDWYCDREMCDGTPHGHFGKHARSAQRLPNDLPRGVYWRGGRGSGKTKAATMAFAALIADNFDEPLEWAVVAPTAGDARTVCMESVQSGLLVALGAKVASGGTILDPGPYVDRYSKTTATIYLKSGGIVYSDGADDGAYRIQGKNLSGAMCDEVGLWKNWKVAWDESLRYAVRIAPAKLVICGTPKRTMPARALVKRLLADDVSLGGRIVNRQLLTRDNAANLDEDTLHEFLASMGTALERQELEGDLIDEIDGAMWRIETIDNNRLNVPVDEAFETINPLRVVIAIDPAVTAGDDSDETGIIVAAKGSDGRGYVLEDLSGKYRPEDWPPVVLDAAERWNVDRVVAEVNNGGDYIGTVLRAAGYTGAYDTVRATRGKEVRAEPVAMAYQKGRGVHVGTFVDLEEQMCSWVPGEGKSPDRVDACLVAGTLVVTERGEIPIEHVTVDDRVWTRSGWRRVEARRLSRKSARVISVELSNGRVLTGTPDHRIATGDEWMRLDSLVWGDRLEGWTTDSQSSSKAWSTLAAQTRSNEPIACTSSPLVAVDERHCIETSIGASTAQFPRASTSITLTRTRLTTIRSISWLSHRLSTPRLMLPSSGGSVRRGWRQFGLLAWRGIKVRRAERGTVSTERNRGRAEVHHSSSVSSVERQPRDSSLPIRQTMDHSVHGRVREDSLTVSIDMSERCRVQSVPSRFGNPSIAPVPQPVPVHVRGNFDAGEADVYDLQVEGSHEFVAEGVIVHNCVWAMTYLGVVLSSSWAVLYEPREKVAVDDAPPKRSSWAAVYAKKK